MAYNLKFSVVRVMRTVSIIMAGLICLGLVFLSCSKEEKASPSKQEPETVATEMPFYAVDILPGDIDSLGIKMPFYAVDILPGDIDSLGIKQIGTVKKTMQSEADSSLGQ